MSWIFSNGGVVVYLRCMEQLSNTTLIVASLRSPGGIYRAYKPSSKGLWGNVSLEGLGRLREESCVYNKGFVNIRVVLNSHDDKAFFHE